MKARSISSTQFNDGREIPTKLYGMVYWNEIMHRYIAGGWGCIGTKISIAEPTRQNK